MNLLLWMVARWMLERIELLLFEGDILHCFVWASFLCLDKESFVDTDSLEIDQTHQLEFTVLMICTFVSSPEFVIVEVGTSLKYVAVNHKGRVMGGGFLLN